MTTLEEQVAARPEVSVFWRPGCSSCLKLKEFVEDQDIPFESINLQNHESAMEEILAAGLKGIPVLRRGNTYIYAQSLDDVAELLGVQRDHVRLPHAVLAERWEEVLTLARAVVAWLPEHQLERPAIVTRDRKLKSLCSHIFQVAEAFLKMLDGTAPPDERAVMRSREDIATRDHLLEYADSIIARYRSWRTAFGPSGIPATIHTYYGAQDSGQVLERGVWHSAQHARQLDTIAAGLGAEFTLPPSIYEGLPMPKRLWE